MSDRPPLWLFADQLGPHFRDGDLAGRRIVLIESAHAFAHKRYHRQKLHLVLAGLRGLAAELPDRVTLIRAPTTAPVWPRPVNRSWCTSPDRTPPTGWCAVSTARGWLPKSGRRPGSPGPKPTSRAGPAAAGGS